MNRALIAILVGATLLPACSSGKTEGQKQIDKLTESINGLVASLEKGKAEMKTVLGEYDQVIDNKDGDLLGHFKKFNSGLDDVEKRREAVRKENEKVKANAGPFFAEWEQDLAKYTSDDLRNRSRERMNTTKQRYEAVQQAAEEARAAYEPLMKILREHALFLGRDLNKESAATLQDDAAGVRAQADKLYGGIDTTIAAAKGYNQSVAMRTKPEPAAPAK